MKIFWGFNHRWKNTFSVASLLRKEKKKNENRDINDGRRGDADLGLVTDRTSRVEERPVTDSSRGVRGRHSTSDIPVTPTPLAPSFHHGTGEAGSSTQPPAVPFRSRPPLHPHLSHTPVPYEPYGSAHPPSHHKDIVYDPYLQAPTVVRPRIPYRSAIQRVEFFDQMLGAAHQDSSCSTHGYSHAEYGVSSSDPYVPGPADRVSEGDRVFGEEQERVRSLHIQGEAEERGDGDGDGGDSDGGDDDGDGGDDDHDDGDDDGDEEQPVYVAPVAPASGSDGRPCHGKGKGLIGSLMSVMSKFAGSRNKRPDVASDVPALTQKRKKVKPSDWEQTEAAERGPVDLDMPMLHCCRHLLRGGSPTRTASTCHRLSREQLIRVVQQNLGLGLTGGLGFNALELHAVATSRQTSQSHQVRVACYL
ncbi:hypothetical protein M9H77_18512 [Catharanthus roseus]|uniref:Uncharacterized protein n=1 Tax=Catharanthus roseus TaxID=4058 RepID=A0ACC0B7M7_CATRO|nr:hypothetical protein M9H77_18512 [Catharanthus roseus]